MKHKYKSLTAVKSHRRQHGETNPCMSRMTLVVGAEGEKGGEEVHQ